MLSRIGRGSNRSSWRGWGSSRRVRLFAALSLAAVVLAAALAGVAVPAQAAPQRAAVSGVSAQPGDNPGELTIAWDAHPDGATDYRVALAPADGEYSHWRDNTWNAYPADTTVTFSGLVPDAEYKLKVRARFKPAVAGAKRSDWSPTASGAAAGEPTSDDGTSSNSAPSQVGEEKSTSVPDGPEPEPSIESIETRDHTPTTTNPGRGPAYPIALTLSAGDGRTLDPLYEAPAEQATLTFRQNPDYQYSQSTISLYDTGGDEYKKHYSSFTLTNAASVKIVVSEQELSGATLSLYVGQDEHRIVKHGNGGWEQGRNSSSRTHRDIISFVDLQPGTYGIRMEATSGYYGEMTMKMLAIPIQAQSDAATLDGGIWTGQLTAGWALLQQISFVAISGTIGSGSNPTDVSDWHRFLAIPPVTDATAPGVKHDSVLQITVTSDEGAWFLLWNSDGKSIGYGLANGRVATGYKWASDLQAERDVYIEIRPSAAALEVEDDNGFSVYVTRLYRACTEIIDGLTTLVAFECE